LKNHPSLVSLFLVGTQVTDAGLKELKQLKNLDTLYIGDTQVTDVGMKELKDVKTLTSALSQPQVRVAFFGFCGNNGGNHGGLRHAKEVCGSPHGCGA
jgi:hypothetical protein